MVYHATGHHYVWISFRWVSVGSSTVARWGRSIIIVRHHIDRVQIVLLDVVIHCLLVLIHVLTARLRAWRSCIFPLIKVNSIIFRWGHTLGISRKRSSFTIIGFVSGSVSLRMHPNRTHLLVNTVWLELWDKRTLLFATNRASNTYNFINSHLISSHVIEQRPNRLLILVVNRHWSEDFLVLLVIIDSRNVLIWHLSILTNWRSVMMWRNVFWHEVILVRRWHKLLILTYHLLRVNVLCSFLWASWNVNLLALTSNWRFHMHVLVRMASFHPCRVISLMVNEFHLLSSFFRIIKILGCLVEHLNLAHILHSILHFLFDTEFKIFIKTTSCRASSWVSRSLPLSFNTFNDFPSFWIDPTKWIHSAILWVTLIMPKVGISRIKHSLIMWHSLSIWRCHINMLTCRSMVHILLLIDSRSNV